MEITWNQYLDLAENGARPLVVTMRFRLLDGYQNDKKSYFIFDDGTDKIYLVLESQAAELMAMKLAGVSGCFIREEFMRVIGHE